MLIEEFTTYLRSEKRRSPHTVKAYYTDLMQFQQFLAVHFEVTDISQATEVLFRDWVVSLKSAGTDNNSINRKRSAANMFYNFLVRNDILAANPISNLKSLKTKKRIAVYVPEKDMEKIEIATKGSSHKELLKSIIIELFYQTGMRLSELSGLKVSDIDQSNAIIKVHGKRNKVRLVPFHKGMNELLNKYKSSRAQISSANESFLLQGNGKKPGLSTISRIVNHQLSEVTTISKTSPHVLRHTFATHILNNGGSISAVKELLGHASLAATQVYTHNSIEQLKKVYEQAHPKGE